LGSGRDRPEWGCQPERGRFKDGTSRMGLF
jgi:hypothetical protein